MSELSCATPMSCSVPGSYKVSLNGLYLCKDDGPGDDCQIC